MSLTSISTTNIPVMETREKTQQKALLRATSAAWLTEALDKITLDKRSELKTLFVEYNQAMNVSFEDLIQPILTRKLCNILQVESPIILLAQTTKWTGWWGPKFIIEQTILKIVARGV